jgi:hypothetical protein
MLYRYLLMVFMIRIIVIQLLFYWLYVYHSKENNYWRTREVNQRGVECETIKIHRRNLGYIPKSTRHPSFLTWSRSHSYRKAIGTQDWVKNYSGNTNRCRQEHVRDQRQKLDQKSVYGLPVIHWTLYRCV